MTVLRLLPVILSALFLSAHFLRIGHLGPMAVSLAAPLLLLLKRRWSLTVLQILLLAGALIWIDTTVEFVKTRIAFEQPWARLAIILGTVAIFTLLSAYILRSKKNQRLYNRLEEYANPSAGAFIFTGILLAVVQFKVGLPLLLLERFIPGLGWFEIFLLSTYAAVITEKMLDPSKTPVWRRRIWLLFSAVFFAQLILGLAGFEKFLMTGKLHLPIPAMIIAGPLYRGEGLFMPILFVSTVLLVGPAWCSHLCYIGAWDSAASGGRKKPKKLPHWRTPVRIIITIIVIATAIVLRLVGVSSVIATILGLAFGLVGVAVMLLWSRKTGSMTHCVVFCPIGLLADWLGKINPFRIKINDNCTDCGICRLSCRYDALNLSDIKRRKPAVTCTLCGDCLHSCEDGFIEYSFPGLKARTARTVFIVMIVSLHAACMGLARI